jgi:hypothetical protein
MLAAMRIRLAFVMLAGFLGCAHATTAAPQKPAADAKAAGVAAPAPTRDFPRDAPYRELVTALAAELVSPPETSHCLLAGNAQGYRFAGDASVALHPLPDMVDNLDDVVRDANALRVLTRHGSFGSVEATLAFVALTDAPATHGAVVLAITDRALYVRGTHDGTALPVRDLEELVSMLTPLVKDATLYVAAEPRIPLSKLYETLSRLKGLPAPVVLATALPSDVVLPTASTAHSAPLRCPDGLPETSAVTGDLSVDALTRGLAPLKDQGMTCLKQADGPGSAGGRLRLALRIDAHGKVSDACLVTSDVEDDALASCVLGQAVALRFDAPSPQGVVDAELPLALRPDSVPAQPPVCP